MTYFEIFSELEKILNVCRLIMEKAGRENNYEPAYDMIFSKRISRRVYFLTEKVFDRFEYYDPDCDYADDCLAFVSALGDYVKNMNIDEEIKDDVIELFLSLPADWKS